MECLRPRPPPLACSASNNLSCRRLSVVVRRETCSRRESAPCRQNRGDPRLEFPSGARVLLRAILCRNQISPQGCWSTAILNVRCKINVHILEFCTLFEQHFWQNYNCNT